ncbi:MAG: N-acetylmuramoyl-L-alanine amidase [Duganella sp.]
MRKGTARRRRILGFVSLLTAAVMPAWAGELRGVDITAGATGTRAELQLDGAGAFNTISLHGPERLVVDFPASAPRAGLKMPAAAGIIKSVRTGQPVPGTLRVVFDLNSSVTMLAPRLEGHGAQSRLVIEWPGDGPEQVAVAAIPTQPVPPTTPAQASAPQASMPVTPQPSAAQATAALASSAAAASATPATRTISPQDILNGNQTVETTPAASAPGKGVTPNGMPYTVATGKPATTPEAAAARAAAEAMESNKPVPAATPVPRAVAGTRPLVIAIDPGHGGQDSGAIGPTGKYEKNAVLAIARELARQIDATPGMKAYLTRDSDYFIPLNQRAVKARAAKADMFVSIHADAAENRSASGSSVYVLSTKGASSQRARWLADKENSSDLVGGVSLTKADNTLSSVLIDLAQSGHMRASEDAAGYVLTGLKNAGNNHKPHIERANFAVLRTSDMPSMLVETAFISNYDEEKRLVDPGFQRKIASAVLSGVKTYFTRQPPPGTLFAAMAAGQVTAGASSSSSESAP